MKCKDNENEMQDNGMEWKARSMLGSQRKYLSPTLEDNFTAWFANDVVSCSVEDQGSKPDVY